MWENDFDNFFFQQVLSSKFARSVSTLRNMYVENSGKRRVSRKRSFELKQLKNPSTDYVVYFLRERMYTLGCPESIFLSVFYNGAPS